jgi:hypothetical protein
MRIFRTYSSAGLNQGVRIMKALSRLLLSVFATGGAVMALSAPAHAVLQFSVGTGSSEETFTCVDNSACDANPATGTISIPTISFEGITATDVQVWATGDSLNFTVGSLTNDTDGTLNGIFAVSDTDFSSTAGRFKTSFSTTWVNAPGSSVDLLWVADRENRQGATSPQFAPGFEYDSFSASTESANAFASYSNSGALNVSPPFSLTVLGSIDLTSGGTESASESAVIAVPEASTWTMLIAGFAGLGIAGYLGSRKCNALAV